MIGGIPVWVLGLVLAAPVMVLALWAQWRVKRTFNAAHQIPASSGMTGAEVAQMILEAHNVQGVGIEPAEGFLSDHYDPKAKMLRLSPDVYSGRSVASLGIAAHEVGHALQDATGYPLLVVRNGIVRFAMPAAYTSEFILLGGLLAMAVAPALGQTLLLAGIALFSLVVIFQIVNLPVEFDASKRARTLLFSTGMVAGGTEQRAMGTMLNAAALTYVAATIQSVITLVTYILHYLAASQSRD